MNHKKKKNKKNKKNLTQPKRMTRKKKRSPTRKKSKILKKKMSKKSLRSTKIYLSPYLSNFSQKKNGIVKYEALVVMGLFFVFFSQDYFRLLPECLHMRRQFDAENFTDVLYMESSA